MIVNNEFENESLIAANGKTVTMGISNNAIFLHNLSDTLYQHKMLAAIREPICNAWDAHTDAGIPKRPILVTFTSDAVHIKDYGKGISKDNFAEIYGIFGNSTKQNDANQIGGFGLGCKAPYAYVDTFSVISCHNGIKTIYSLNKVSHVDGKPAITEIVSMPTTDTGLEVIIPYKSTSLTNDGSISDERYLEIGHIKEVVTSTAFFASQSILMKVESKGKKAFKLPKMDHIEENEGALCTSSFNSKLPSIGDGMRLKSANVLYNNVLYPINMDQIPTELKDRIRDITTRGSNRRLETAIIIRAIPGEVFVTPSRETLSYTETTKATLVRLLEETCDKIENANSLEVFKKVLVEEYENLSEFTKRIAMASSPIELNDLISSIVYRHCFKLAEKNDLLVANSDINTVNSSSYTLYNSLKNFNVLITQEELHIYNAYGILCTHASYSQLNYHKLLPCDYSEDSYLFDNYTVRDDWQTNIKKIKGNMNHIYGPFYKLGLENNVHVFNTSIGSMNIPASSKLTTLHNTLKQDRFFKNHKTAEAAQRLMNINTTGRIVYIFLTKKYLDEEVYGVNRNTKLENDYVSKNAYADLSVVTGSIGLQLKKKDAPELANIIKSLESDGYIVIDHYSEDLRIREITKPKEPTEKSVKESGPKKDYNARSSFLDLLLNCETYNNVTEAKPIKDEDSSFVIQLNSRNMRDQNFLTHLGSPYHYNDEFTKATIRLLNSLGVDGTVVSTELRYDKAIEDGLVPFEEWLYQMAIDFVDDPNNKTGLQIAMYYQDSYLNNILRVNYGDTLPEVCIRNCGDVYNLVRAGHDLSKVLPFYTKQFSHLSKLGNPDEPKVSFFERKQTVFISSIIKLNGFFEYCLSYTRNYRQSDEIKKLKESFATKLRLIFGEIEPELFRLTTITQAMSALNVKPNGYSRPLENRASLFYRDTVAINKLNKHLTDAIIKGVEEYV